MKLTTIFAGILLLLFSPWSQGVMITGAFTGAWYDEDAPGQGYLLQVLDQDGVQTAMVFWFTYDAQGNQQWLNGLGEVDGESVTVELLYNSGGELTASGFSNAGLTSESWGTLTLSFHNCNKGTASYEAVDPTYGSGSHVIKRLSKTIGSECSGGVSDNTPPSAGESDVQIDFTNTGEDDDASGRLKFEQNSQFTKLKLWYKKLPAGTYQLLVDGEEKATLVAKANGQSHQFFSSPQLSDWILLDFEIEGKKLDIAQDGVIYLTATLP